MPTFVEALHKKKQFHLKIINNDTLFTKYKTLVRDRRGITVTRQRLKYRIQFYNMLELLYRKHQNHSEGQQHTVAENYNLSQHMLKGDDIKHLMILLDCQKITYNRLSLNLSANHFGDIGVYNLIKFISLKKPKNLSLNVSSANCYFDYHFLHHISKDPQKDKVSTFTLSKNGLTCLLSILTLDACPQFFQLAIDGWRDPSAEDRYGKQSGVTFAEILAKQLKKITPRKDKDSKLCLSLRRNAFRDTGAKHVFSVLDNMNHAELNLEFNLFTCIALEYLHSRIIKVDPITGKCSYRDNAIALAEYRKNSGSAFRFKYTTPAIQDKTTTAISLPGKKRKAHALTEAHESNPSNNVSPKNLTIDFTDNHDLFWAGKHNKKYVRLVSQMLAFNKTLRFKGFDTIYRLQEPYKISLLKNFPKQIIFNDTGLSEADVSKKHSGPKC
jgi:hypothetical protein